MRAFETVHAEPRDSLLHESPNYRVNFWKQPAPGYSWTLDACVLTDVQDVRGVLEWAEVNAHGRIFEVFVEMDEEPVAQYETPRTSGLVRLFGANPNEGEGVEIGRFVEL